MNVVHRPAIVALSTIAFLLAPHVAVAQPVAPPQEPDVLVVGGTPAGVAAAVTAARLGENVTFVASDAQLGGVLTGAMMDQWDLNLAADGASIEGGLFDEMYDRLGDAFSPESASRTFAALVAGEPRITVRYEETATAVATTGVGDGSRVDAVTFTNARTGTRSAVRAPLVIDATDSADIAVLAGAHYDFGRQDTGVDERAQAVTQIFTFHDVNWRTLAETYDALQFGAGGVSERRAWGYARLMRAYVPASPDVIVRDLNFGLMRDGNVSVNAVDVFGINGLDARERDRARRLTQAEAPHLLAFLRTRLPGFQHATVGEFAPNVYVRETRHVAGLERLTSDDIWLGRIPPDSIGLSSYPLDLHPVDATDRAAYAPIRHVYGIPFGTLVPKGLSNVVLASPAISATHLASGSVRIVPSTIEEGEAAGVASNVARRDGIDFEALAMSTERVVELRRALATRGVIVGAPETGQLAHAAHALRTAKPETAG